MSQAVTVRPPTGGSTSAAPQAGAGRRWSLIALVAGLLAVVCAVLLPVAPVSMSQPVVSWPQDPAAPTSTMLQLTAQTPLRIDASFSCAAARVAGGTDDGVILATVVPGQPSSGGQGLLARAGEDGLTIRANDRTLVDGAPVAGDCVYRVTGDAAGLTVTRDGDVVGSAPDALLPAVDVLATSLTDLSPADGELLAVELAVDDQFATTPSLLKWLLMGLLVVGAAVSFAFLVAEHRTRRRGAAPAARRGRRFGPVDVVVPLVMLVWMFLAPMSDDDGYYAAMARSAADEGMVGNYYQLLNQNFTPFTWFYRALGVWEGLVGSSPAMLRVPSLVTGLLTWLALRRFTSQPGALPAVLERSARGRTSLAVVLGVAFLAWWMPFGVGVRPEALVGFAAAAVLLLMSSAIRRGSLPRLGLAVVVAALGVVSHPTGFVSLAPLLAGAPAAVRLIRDGVPAARAGIRGLAVVAPGAVAAIAAFGDGSLNDFLRGQQIFLSIQAQNSWFDEYQRYAFLFAQDPMGNYAKRAAVLLGLASLVWFAVLAAVSRSRRGVSPQLLMAASSLALAFLLLWITPSKWTHHFGALSGLGPAFLALFLVSLPVLARAVPGGLRTGWPLAVPALGTVAVVAALSFHGPNSWAYSWLQGVPQSWQRPHLSVLPFDSLVVWLLGAAVVVGLVRLVGRRAGLPRRRPWLTAVPIVAAIFLGLSVTFLFGSFAYAAATTQDTYSPWGDAISDPLGSTCGPTKAVEVLDVEAATPLPAVPGTGDRTGEVFAPGSGFYPASPPPVEPGTGPATDVWGSLDGDVDGSAVGEFTTPWYELPSDVGADERVAVLVAGKLDEAGNELTVEYGRQQAGGFEVLASAGLRDDTQSAVWRARSLDLGVAPDADAVRLVARDGTTGSPGWLATTGPSVVPVERLDRYLPEDAAVATAWQFSFLFPCQRQLDITNGITEPMEYAVMWGGQGVDGLGDATWQLGRGGLFAPTLRNSSVTQVGGWWPDWPGITTLQVFRVVAPYPDAAYEVRETTETRWGWQGPDEARWPYGEG
ncbi:arabinosyltransferase domain-containing protein [Blastococcus xanthinilyticus]|uniref:Arabinosyltransferase B/arabinosyltransferase C n=1 Tax=Blastococcus xanthinilyticus TaxID=1564164 RepID=A0A5S5D3A2_9ACTN|nr:arabinosyltransferase domain-containing protein [Blastococcus xanthinilyticus]TYP89864.1 arabinosyltransferase B/arabinosyltransferase C [Blastococcus xanthinilyticus]